MDSSLKISIVKEQVAKEGEARRGFQKNWSQLVKGDLNKFYDPNELDQKILKETAALEEHKLYKDDTSYFVSPAMYKSLLGVCRCGRLKNGVHLSKCLQKESEKLVENPKHLALPKTTNGFIGWLAKNNPQYANWESSTNYDSPTNSRNQPRITNPSYNTIFIG